MTMTTAKLPPVDGSVLADLLDALPPRLRKRLDSMAEKAAAWPLESGEAGTLIARVDDETVVTVRTRDGVLWAADDVHCDCLLAPACLHRAALVALAPPFDAEAQANANAHPNTNANSGPGAGESAQSPIPAFVDAASAASATPAATAATFASAEAGSKSETSAHLTAAERSAAQSLWDAGAALLLGGVIGASLFNEAQFRRVAHQARAIGLHRAAALGNRVAAGLRAGRERRADYSLPQLTADLRDLLVLARALPRAADTGEAAELADLRGIARRGYDHLGGLRLYGLFSEPIITRSGHSGVVTHLVDDTGVLWTTANVMPGEPARVRPAYNTGVGLGGTVLTHRELSRGGLIVSGASASADGRLSGGSASRAVKAAGAQWTEPPIAALFDVPLDQQVERAFVTAALGPDGGARAGADLVFVAVCVVGATEHGFAAVTQTGETVYCVSVQAGYGLPYRRNLEALSHPGLCLRVIARLDPHRPATLCVLAASPDADWDGEQPTAGPEPALPTDWSRRINLGLDTLSQIAGSGVAALRTESAPEPDPVQIQGQGQGQDQDQDQHQDAVPPSDGTALHLLRHRIEQAVAGGRVVAATASADRDASRLSRSALHTAADLLVALAVAAPPRRDAFGRPRPDDGYLEAWLAAAHYEAIASQRLLLRRWLRA
jgi:hypothetical protein